MTHGHIETPPTIVNFAPAKTDVEIANEIRVEMAEHLAAICKILDKARSHGMQAQFALAPDQFGRHNPPHVTVTKAL